MGAGRGDETVHRCRCGDGKRIERLLNDMADYLNPSSINWTVHKKAKENMRLRVEIAKELAKDKK